jgi:bifunctional enzyme CysN/CysC
VANFTGRDQIYEIPEDPDLVLRTVELAPEEAADRVIERLLGRR